MKKARLAHQTPGRIRFKFYSRLDRETAGLLGLAIFGRPIVVQENVVRKIGL